MPQAVLDQGFKRRLKRYMAQLPDGWEMLCLGEGNPAAHVDHNRLKPGLNVYRSKWDRITGTMVQ